VVILRTQPVTNQRSCGILPEIAWSHLLALVATALKEEQILGSGGLTVQTPRKAAKSGKILAVLAEAKCEWRGLEMFSVPPT
jgi:hypothetical protein